MGIGRSDRPQNGRKADPCRAPRRSGHHLRHDVRLEIQAEQPASNDFSARTDGTEYLLFFPRIPRNLYVLLKAGIPFEPLGDAILLAVADDSGRLLFQPIVRIHYGKLFFANVKHIRIVGGIAEANETFAPQELFQL